MDYINENFTDTDNDISFTPLNIKQELSPTNSAFPLLVSLDGLPVSIAPNKNPNLNTLQLPDLKTPVIMPMFPYPENVPNIAHHPPVPPHPPVPHHPPIKDNENLDYPSETDSDELYCYNEDRLDDNYIMDAINPVDILRNVDLTIDSDNYRSSEGINDVDAIFKQIKKNNPGILSTMKLYRIPYPLAKLIIKKIISLSLKYEKR